LYTSSRDSGRNLASFKGASRVRGDVEGDVISRAIGMRVEDTPSQKTGRALIVVSGILLVAVISQIGQRGGGPVGSREWWRAVLTATFEALC
jgi:hypothetical protein